MHLCNIRDEFYDQKDGRAGGRLRPLKHSERWISNSGFTSSHWTMINSHDIMSTKVNTTRFVNCYLMTNVSFFSSLSEQLFCQFSGLFFPGEFSNEQFFVNS